ncbi:MAG TPA: hypothetical protein VF006_12120 [Longimicrobium sp.]
MSDAQRVRDPDGRFTLVPPPGWSTAPDEEDGGLEVWPAEGAGTLHLMSFDAGDDDFPDPAEELYAFLDDRNVELEEDEVADVPLDDGGELAIAEYEAEDEDEGDVTYWLVGVATGPGALVFATYLCPAGEHEAEAELVRASLATLRLTARSGG